MKQSTVAAKAPLEGVRVVEIANWISAPFAATLLADFGADVVKIELPGSGDPMRTLGALPAEGMSGYWWSALGRNKKSVALDIRTPEGREILGRLLTGAELLIENFRPGTLDRWGITPQWLKQIRPDLIIVRISGYGQDGPCRDLPGFDRNAQAFSGLVYVTGEPDSPPQQAGLPVCDYTSGLWAAFGAVLALLGKHRHGDRQGNEVDLALYESMVPFLKEMPQRWRHQGRVTERNGNKPDYVAPGGAYRTGDGDWIFISGTGDRVFSRLMTLVGREDMVISEAYRTNHDRVTHRAEIDGAIDAWLAQRASGDAIAALEQAEVPVVKIQSIAELMDHPQVIARGNFVTVPDHDRGEVCFAAPLPRLARGPANVRWAGQDVGEATRDVLGAELGISDELLAALHDRGVIGAA
jgi:crotonobetainyl-CoA:carnitine CoA-transferase CaiB-like acyl-CoA transferase